MSAANPAVSQSIGYTPETADGARITDSGAWHAATRIKDSGSWAATRIQAGDSPWNVVVGLVSLLLLLPLLAVAFLFLRLGQQMVGGSDNRR